MIIRFLLIETLGYLKWGLSGAALFLIFAFTYAASLEIVRLLWHG